MKELDKLAQRFQYTFSRPGLLRVALTHRSMGSKNNERLEFLGDAVLNFIIADALYQRFEQFNEGDLSRLRAKLVKGDTLAELAQGYELGDFLRLGPGELKSGGFRRTSILAGAMEAIIGAVYVEDGFAAARDFVLSIYQQRLAAITNDTVSKDPKTQLQELLQAQRNDLPVYTVINVEGMEHKQTFQVSCHIATLNETVIGRGSSRRRAEQDAAKKALAILKQN